MQKKILITICTFLAVIISVNLVFAEENDLPIESAPSLRFYAVNAGYKDDNSSQNYDFIELERTVSEDFSLAGFSLKYFNSSDKPSGEITFTEQQILGADRLVLGFSKSPQYVDWEDSPYLYYFSSSGLASTAGRLQLLFNEEIIDELCWGKIVCSAQNPKFATKPEENYSLVHTEDGYEQLQYYPEIQSVITELAIDEEPLECNLIISEIYTYYESSANEQFVELYNPTEVEQDISRCAFSHKNISYEISGTIPPGAYYIYQNPEITFTKNPTTYNVYSLAGQDVLLPHGQKRGTSYALFNIGTETEQWLQTYRPTPAAENIYQEFQTCPDGKVINPETGNCINETIDKETICPEGKYLNLLTGRCKNIETKKATICKEGYYLNILTGRCKKITTTTATECAEGYERNPETNRCRKIRTNTAMEYPVEPVEENSYNNPKIFIATGVIVALILGGAIYAIYQYRKEIKQVILKICRRNAS